MLCNSTFDNRLFLGVSLLASTFLLLAEVHRLALYDLSFGCSIHWVLHAKKVAVDIQEDRRGWLDDTWHQRVLDQLEVELLFRVVAEGRVSVRQLDLKEVRAAERVRVDALRSQRVHVMVVTSMLAKEADAGGVVALGCNLELDDHLLLLEGSAKMEGLLAVRALDIVLAPALVQFHL